MRRRTASANVAVTQPAEVTLLLAGRKSTEAAPTESHLKCVEECRAGLTILL
jgi:hypothetical protein